MNDHEPPRVSLIQRPTPLHRLERASSQLGLDLWIKRDDLTGFALGGNKGRKLEFLIAEALAQRAQVVVTCGAHQSNFIRQLGVACRMFGMQCVAVTMDLPYEDHPPLGIRFSSEIGNPQIDALSGVTLHKLPDSTWDSLFDATEQEALRWEERGKRVYRIPIGGSSALGAYSFIQAAQEVKASGQQFDWIVTSSSSGSTQVGLSFGFRGTSSRVLGMAADPEPDFAQDLAKLADKLAALTGTESMNAQDFQVNLEFVGGGYGVTDLETVAAIRWLAETEGIFLDPCYSGKAMRGLIQLVRRHELGGKVLFWHTGGTPTLFALPGSALWPG